MLGLVISTGIAVGPPSPSDGGFITRHKIHVFTFDKEEREDTPPPVEMGRIELAVVHVAAADESAASLGDVLYCAGPDFRKLHDTYFDEFGLFRHPFRSSPGAGLAFVERITLDPPWLGRNIDLAIVHRLRQTLAEGCKLLVVDSASREEAEHWMQIGFEHSRAGQEHGFMHLSGRGHPRIAEEPNDEHRFKVVPPSRFAWVDEDDKADDEGDEDA